LTDALADTSLTLFPRIAAGDQEAFAALFHLWRDKLYFFVLRITDSEARAEDVLQDVFTRIWQHRQQLTEVRNADAYLYSMARNQAITYLRQMARETVALARLSQAEPAPLAGSDETLFEKELREKLQIILQHLPPQQRQVFTLSRQHGLKKEEIAKELNISASTVKNHMTHALRTIRQELGVYGQLAPALVALILPGMTHL